MSQSTIKPSEYELASVHTNSLTQLLNQFGISLAITTYQAGKLILARSEGDVTNTHFSVFEKPMGMASSGNKLSIGQQGRISTLYNVPSAAQKLEPSGKYDACYIPRYSQITGDIDIHEMVWQEHELWFINTRFSCLCQLDPEFSFVSRWRPPFITAYDMRDRCHLNGLAMRDGKPRYITALGESDSPCGWRKNKASGGILMDISNDQILLRGLSMPHSPRWHLDRLWFLESGKGSLVYVENGKTTTLIELPGFTRGLAFHDAFAFIGLSQVRETAVFSGLPLTRNQPVRYCGVWVVNLKTAEIVAFLRFEQGVREIFAVEVLPHRFPDVIDHNPELENQTYVLPDEILNNVVQPDDHWEFADTHFEQANQLYHENKIDEAINSYRRCLELQPDHLPAKYNLGVALGNQLQFNAAIEQLEQVIAAEAGHAEAVNSLGFIYGKMGQYHKAIDYFEQAIAIQPDYAQTHHNLGMTLLLLGKHQKGWAECEWRWRTTPFTPIQSSQPRWQGKPVNTLLIHTEQGAGDAIQFARYLPLAAQRCKRLIFICPDNLIDLLQQIPGIDACRGSGTIDEQNLDAYAPLMSLPYIFQTTEATIPNDIPYLHAPKNYKLPLPQSSPKQKKIGIVWAGNSSHSNDQYRSASLVDFMPLLEVPGCQFYNLQMGDQVKELRQLQNQHALIDLSEQITNYNDTAALIAQLDLIISVDTSVVHLAGAMGKPVWTLLCHRPDWRFQLNKTTTTWYPTMRLFRQQENHGGSWEAVIESAITLLNTWKMSSHDSAFSRTSPDNQVTTDNRNE